MRRFALSLLVLTLAASTAALGQAGAPPAGGRGAPGAAGGPGGGPPRPEGADGPYGSPGAVGPARVEGPGGQGPPPFARDLFPAELVLQNQLAIGLTEAQIASIKKLLNETHSRTLDVETELRRFAEKLRDALRPQRVDEAAALGFADQVMKLETEMKKTHLAMLIRLKNLLTPEQQAKLRELQPKP
jgi:hypothetical protein